MNEEYSLKQKRKFLKFARKALKCEFEIKKIKIPNKKEFQEIRAVLITLTTKNLKKAIGFSNKNYSTGKAITKAMNSAIFNDANFPRLTKELIKNMKIKITILSSLIEIKENIEQEIQLGKHGLICQYWESKGLFLPEIAMENKMNKLEFIETLCEKTGLPKDSWKNKNVKFYKFKTQNFQEE